MAVSGHVDLGGVNATVTTTVLEEVVLRQAKKLASPILMLVVGLSIACLVIDLKSKAMSRGERHVPP